MIMFLISGGIQSNDAAVAVASKLVNLNSNKVEKRRYLYDWTYCAKLADFDGSPGSYGGSYIVLAFCSV